MKALLIALALAAGPDGGVRDAGSKPVGDDRVESSWDGGSCQATFGQTKERCSYEGRRKILNPKTGKWRVTDFEGTVPCGKSAELCGKEISCVCGYE
jgi:hypothetical protein